jgi:hypothetical protein
MKKKKTDLLQVLNAASHFLGLALYVVSAANAIPDRMESLILQYKELRGQLYCPRYQETTNVFKKEVLDERNK